MGNIKTALVTGGATGIGKAIVSEFLEQGCNVLLGYNSSKQKAQEIMEHFSHSGYQGKLKIFKADVSNRIEVDQMVDYCLSEFKRIDVVVNNAGVSHVGLFTDMSIDKWNHVMDTNLTGVFNVTQSCLKKYMINVKNGAIINISSIWGITGGSCEVGYSASKAGVIGLTKALAKELAFSNITVNCIAPGAIGTDMIYNNYSKEDIDEMCKNEIPMGRMGKPEEISSLVAYIASDKARYITGQVISPNGGTVI